MLLGGLLSFVTANSNQENILLLYKELGLTVKLILNPTSSQVNSVLNEIAVGLGRERERALLPYFAGHGETLELADGTQLGCIIPTNCPLKGRDPRGFDENLSTVKGTWPTIPQPHQYAELLAASRIHCFLRPKDPSFRYGVPASPPLTSFPPGTPLAPYPNPRTAYVVDTFPLTYGAFSLIVCSNKGSSIIEPQETSESLETGLSERSRESILGSDISRDGGAYGIYVNRSEAGCGSGYNRLESAGDYERRRSNHV